MIKVGQTTTNQTIALPYELTNEGDTSISLQELKGNTTQNGTPTPTSPQQVNVVKGKNLVEGSQDFSGTWNNSNYWETDNTTYNGLIVKKREGQWQGIYKEINVIQGQTYTFSLFAKSDSSRSATIYLSSGTATASPSNKSVTTTTEWARYSITFTASTSGTIRPRLENSTSSTGNYTYICGYQLEQGSTATPYLPPNTIEVKVVGKNLEEQIEQGGINGSGENYSSTTMIRSKYFIPVRPNTTYALSINGQGEGFNVAQYDENKTFISFTYNWQRVTTANNTRYIRINKTASINDKIQVEEGNTATPYEAYKSNNYLITLGDIELCKIGTYQDRIYKNNGKWYLEKQVGKVVLANTGYFASGGVSNIFYTTFITDYATSNNIPYSNQYTGVNNVSGASGMSSQANNTIGFINQSGSTAPRFYIKDTRFSTEADLNNWIKNNPLEIYYVLATPTTTEITDETLLEQLEAIGELYRGTNNIMITDTIAPVENIIIEKSNAEFDLVPYIKREPKLDYIDRKGDTGYTADGHYFENIIARKRAVEFELIPMSQEDYANVISRFLNITSIPVFISDTYTNQNLKLNMFKKAIISNTQLTEYGRIRGTKISLEEI